MMTLFNSVIRFMMTANEEFNGTTEEGGIVFVRSNR